ncbi:unnamed protein product, partial [Durusdinium trenchii]
MLPLRAAPSRATLHSLGKLRAIASIGGRSCSAWRSSSVRASSRWGSSWSEEVRACKRLTEAVRFPGGKDQAGEALQSLRQLWLCHEAGSRPARFAVSPAVVNAACTAIDWGLVGGEEAHDILQWLAKEVASRLGNFSPGTGVAGTAYVHVIHREPSGKLLPLLEEHLTLLTSRKSLTPRAIANFINLLYGSSSEHQPSQTLSHLRLEAAGTLSSFAATELLDVASGLAKCQQLDCNFLQDLRRAVDSMPFEPPPSPEHPWDVADPSKTWRCPQPPRLLADFPDALVLSKPAGWSCATGRASRATGGDGRGGPAPARVAEVLAASFPELSPFQDAAADHGMAHRLDLETSGALLLGKSLRSFWRLRLEFVAQKVKRQYLTLVQGRLGPLGVAQQVQEPLRLQRLRRSNPTRSVQSKSLVCETGRPARTRFVPLAHVKSREGGDMTLLSAEPLTGRTHQIRSHLA